MIPDLDDGVLPEGIHICTVEEIVKVFGTFRKTESRPRLTERLRAYIEEARAASVVKAIIIDGSYVTAKDEPNDIDILLVLRRELDLTQELRPAEYNVQSKRMVKRQYGFDVLTAIEDSETYQNLVHFFARVNPLEKECYTKKGAKGVLRIEL
ncbi:MAG: hypothetical protein J2P31_06885 [Blastocatellia bacterium]|nr:hypothetical protein [Blastocatellia bacterium]